VEHEVAKGGGVFAQSGVYALMKDLTKADYDRMEDREKADEGVKIAARGFSPLKPDNDEMWTRHMVKVLFEDIPACWRDQRPEYIFDPQQYVPVGAALARNPPPPVVGSGKRRAWGPLLTGSWIESEGKLQLDAMSRKRLPPKDAQGPGPRFGTGGARGQSLASLRRKVGQRPGQAEMDGPEVVRSRMVGRRAGSRRRGRREGLRGRERTRARRTGGCHRGLECRLTERNMPVVTGWPPPLSEGVWIRSYVASTDGLKDAAPMRAASAAISPAWRASRRGSS
jgi:hypothetical protein